MAETREQMLARWNTAPTVHTPTNDGHGEPASADPWGPMVPAPVLHDVSPAHPNHIATN